MIIIFVCTMILLWLIFILIKYSCKEGFSDPVLVKRTPDIIDVTKMFDDVIVYDNDTDGRIGFDKCIEKCKGYCVEYGQTGSAYCYPVVKQEKKNFDGMIVPNERKLVFPDID